MKKIIWSTVKPPNKGHFGLCQKGMDQKVNKRMMMMNQTKTDCDPLQEKGPFAIFCQYRVFGMDR